MIMFTKFIHKQLLSIIHIAVQIGFDQTSYTVAEGNESVSLCVNMTTGSANVPVSLETINIGSAQSTCMNSCCLSRYPCAHMFNVYVSATGYSSSAIHS